MADFFVPLLPLPLPDFMEQAITYYYKNQQPFGSTGDFITAPDMSQLFGETIAVWCVHQWQLLGEPQDFLWVEVGGGRGTLMADMTRTVQKISPTFAAAMQIHCIEISTRLKALQQQKIPQGTWHKTIESLPAHLPIIMVANEFLDALPIAQYIKVSNTWQERGVAKNETELFFTTQPAEKLPFYIDYFASEKEGAVVEYSAAVHHFIEELSVRLKTQHGAALLVDYGYTEYLSGDTLQAMQNHVFVDVLDGAGTADITAHVNFAMVKDVATQQGLRVVLQTQRDFLHAYGIAARLAVLLKTANTTQQQTLVSGYQRLTDAAQMGQLFKVIEITR